MEPEGELADVHERAAKTHKGRRYLDKFKPTLNEEPRKCLLIKGNKTSDSIQKFLDVWVRDLFLYLLVSNLRSTMAK
jgi:hypothetical protein